MKRIQKPALPLKAGDVVVLLSGSPKMTIESIREGELITFANVIWFNQNDSTSWSGPYYSRYPITLLRGQNETMSTALDRT